MSDYQSTRWARIAVDFDRHPKYLGLSDTQKYLVIKAILYCREFLTDGVIPSGVWSKLGRKRDRDALVDAGIIELFLEVDEDKNISKTGDLRQTSAKLAPNSRHTMAKKQPKIGAKLRGYLDWQDSRQQVEEKTQKRRTAGQKGGQAKARNQQKTGVNNLANATHFAKQTPKHLLSREREREERSLLTVASNDHGDHPRDPNSGRSQPINVEAHKMAQANLDPQTPASIRTAIAIEATILLTNGAHPTDVATAIAEWNTRTGVTPRILAHLTADATKRRNGHAQPPANPRAPTPHQALLDDLHTLQTTPTHQALTTERNHHDPH